MIGRVTLDIDGEVERGSSCRIYGIFIGTKLDELADRLLLAVLDGGVEERPPCVLMTRIESGAMVEQDTE